MLSNPETKPSPVNLHHVCDQNLVEVDDNGVVIKMCQHLIFFAISRYSQVGLEAKSPTFTYPLTTPEKIAVCTKVNTLHPENPLSIVCRPYALRANYQVRIKEKKSTASK